MLANESKLKEIDATFSKNQSRWRHYLSWFWSTCRLSDFRFRQLQIRYSFIYEKSGRSNHQNHCRIRFKRERSVGETGVWLDVGKPYARKICALGVKTSKWVTMHGFAINVNTDLRYFEYIIPCGIKGQSSYFLKRELEREFK